MKQLTGYEPFEEVVGFIESGERVYLSASALSTMLKAVAFQNNCADDIQRIADVLECESVEYEDAKSALIAHALFELSSPEINGVTTPDRCAELAANLDAPLPD